MCSMEENVEIFMKFLLFSLCVYTHMENSMQFSKCMFNKHLFTNSNHLNEMECT